MTVTGIVFVVISFILAIIAMIREDRHKECFMLAFIAGVFLITGINCLSERNAITPMDVYQGKTTLRITYQDSIPVDSCVVWKKNINQ